jgi:hypothetical protein
LADCASLYGIDLGSLYRSRSSRDYEQFVGLYLLRFRSHNRVAHQVQLGVQAALAKWLGVEMGEGWFQSLAESADEAKYLRDINRGSS